MAAGSVLICRGCFGNHRDYQALLAENDFGNSPGKQL